MRLLGYAAVFDKWSVDMGFRERIRRGAFSRTLKDGTDKLALHHHRGDLILGRTSNDSLKLWEDSTGLAFDLSLPSTSLGKDVYQLVKRGDLTTMSFAFSLDGPRGERWEESSSGELLRELLDLTLIEVSTTAQPAYLDTLVQARLARQREPGDHALHARHFRLMHGRITAISDDRPRRQSRGSKVSVGTLARHRQLAPSAREKAPRRRASRLTRAQLLERHRRLKPTRLD